MNYVFRLYKPRTALCFTYKHKVLTALNYGECSRTANTLGEGCYELYQVFVTILKNVVTLVIATPGTEFVWAENYPLRLSSETAEVRS